MPRPRWLRRLTKLLAGQKQPPLRWHRPWVEVLEDRLAPAAGDLDPSFGGNWFVTTSFGGDYNQAEALAIQDDGKIVAVHSLRSHAAHSSG